MSLIEELNKIEAKIRNEKNTILTGDMNVILVEAIIKLQKLLYTNK